MLARLNKRYSLFPSAWPSGIGILILWSEPTLGTAIIAGSITPAPTLPSFALASPNPQPTSPPAIPKPTTLATAAVPTAQKSQDALPSPADPPALSVTVTNSPSTNQHPNSPYGSSPGQGAAFGNLVFAKYCPLPLYTDESTSADDHKIKLEKCAGYQGGIMVSFPNDTKGVCRPIKCDGVQKCFDIYTYDHTREGETSMS
jgi:hypothetical protein